MSVLFCDSNCELWFETLKELPVNCIRMPYTIDGEEFFYDNGENTDFAAFYGKMRSKLRSITSALNENDYIEYFEKYFAAGEDILYVSFSHKLSSTFDSMNSAVEKLSAKYPGVKFTNFDTRSISLGAGIQVYHAALAKAAGATDEEILAKLAYWRDHVRTYFSVDDLFHLKRGGRLSGVAAFAGTMLSLKPILHVDDEGAIKPWKKVRGGKLAIKTLADTVVADAIDEDYEIYLVSADCDDDVDELERCVRERVKPDTKIIRQTVGPVIATHCGPGTAGIIFMAK